MYPAMASKEATRLRRLWVNGNRKDVASELRSLPIEVTLYLGAILRSTMLDHEAELSILAKLLDQHEPNTTQQSTEAPEDPDAEIENLLSGISDDVLVEEANRRGLWIG